MLKLSTTTRYAIRMLVFIAMKEEEGPVTRRAIEAVEKVTPDYAEQILLKLKAAGVVKSHRGARGGYSMGLPAEKVTVLKVVEILEGVIDLGSCDKEDCDRFIGCAVRDVWASSTEAIIKEFEAYTIAGLAASAKERREKNNVNFEI